MSASKQHHSGEMYLKENCTDALLPPTGMTTKVAPAEQIKCLRILFESVEDMLRSPDYYEDLQNELSASLPNFMNVLLTAKRDLLKNDCGIVVAGETSAGKTTLINTLVGKELFETDELPSTGTITRIRDSKQMEIKCYTEKEILVKEEKIQDLKKLQSAIRRLTDINEIPQDLKDIYYVDVHLPMPLLKGNVILVDTPGIGEFDRLDEMLLDFLPHAVSFVFVVSANNVGGIHKTKLLKILKTICDNQDKMPCFDPREVMFLTNKWDIIKNKKPSSDEDNDGKSKTGDDQHTKIWKHIQKKLKEKWLFLDIEKVFRVSLEQVDGGEKGGKDKIDETSFFTDEYKRFETVLKNTIEKNKNKRVDFYFKFLKDFVRNAWRGTLTRFQLLNMPKEEQKKIILENNTEIQFLQLKCKQAKKELESYKSETIFLLTEKLYAYLHSTDGRKEILNPPEITPINDIKYNSLKEVVPFRFSSGIQRWCEGQEAKLIIEAADAQLKPVARNIESKLRNIEIKMTGMKTIIIYDRTHEIFNNSFGGPIYPLSVKFVIGLSVLFFPILFDGGSFINKVIRGLHANDIYDACLKNISISKLREGFEASFGVAYSETLDCIFDKYLLTSIRSLLITNERLLENEQRRESLMRLEGKIREIQIASEKFEKL